MLFQDVGNVPQAPAVCIFPNDRKSMSERRLMHGGKDSKFVMAAEEACNSWSENLREACLYDVLATGDLNMAF